MSNIPDDLLDLVKELVVIEEQTRKRQQAQEDLNERLYEDVEMPEPEPRTIKISLE